MQFCQLTHLMANVEVYKCLANFCSSSYRLRDIKIVYFFYLQKVGHGVQFSQIYHSMANAKIYKHHFFIFAKVWPVRTIVTHSHRNGQSPGCRRILHICLMTMTAPFRGFVRYKRAKNQYRTPDERVNDWDEIFNHKGVMKGIQVQAAR